MLRYQFLPLWIALMLLSAMGFGQDPASDSLYRHLTIAGTDSLKVEASLALGQYFLNKGKPDSAIAYAFQVLNEEPDNPEQAFRALIIKGRATNQQGLFDQSLLDFRKAKGLANGYNLGDNIPIVHQDLGLTHRLTSNYDSAIFHFKEAELAFEQSSYPYNKWSSLSGLGDLYRDIGDMEKAMIFFRKAFEVVKDSSRRADKGFLLYKAISLSYEMGDYEDYGYFIGEWNKFQASDKASVFLLKDKNHRAFPAFLNDPLSDQIKKHEELVAFYQGGTNQFRKGVSWENLGRLYQQAGRMIEAEHAYQKSILHYSAIDDLVNVARVNLSLYHLARELEDYPQALTAFEAYNTVLDSFQSQELLERTKEMEVRYQVKETQQALELQEIETLLRTRQRNYSILAAILVALVGLSIFIVFYIRLQATRKIAAQNAQIQEQKLKELKQEQLLSSYSSMVQAQELERNRISKDLHDSLGGYLSLVKAQLHTIQDLAIRTQLLNRFDEVFVELRRISHDLLPATLSVAGLKEATQELVDKLSGTELDVDFQSFGDLSILSEKDSIMLYRIIQELVQNVLKHAQASQLMIQIMRNPEDLSIVVEDNGNGFDADSLKVGNGIANIQARVAVLGGTIGWDSIPRQGTSALLNIPLSEGQEDDSIANKKMVTAL